MLTRLGCTAPNVHTACRAVIENCAFFALLVWRKPYGQGFFAFYYEIIPCQKSHPITAICEKIIIGMPIINFLRFVLCLINRMVTNMATEPPRTDKINNVLSFVRHRCFLAARLSSIVTMADIKLTAII